MEPLQRVTAPTLDVLEQLLASEDPVWGLLIVKQTGRTAGTIYPILDRLERLGWVSSAWEEDEVRPGPRRRMYTLTGEAAPAALELLNHRRRPTTAIPREARA